MSTDILKYHLCLVIQSEIMTVYHFPADFVLSFPSVVIPGTVVSGSFMVTSF